MFTKEQVEEIREKGLYDFIANNYWKLRKEEIVIMFKEFDYSVHFFCNKCHIKATEMMIEKITELDNQMKSDLKRYE